MGKKDNNNFLDDFSGAFKGTQSRPLVSEIKADSSPVSQSNKPEPETTELKSVSLQKQSSNNLAKSKAKQEEIKRVQIYIPASLYKKIIKTVSNNVIKNNQRFSVSSHIKEVLEKEYVK